MQLTINVDESMFKDVLEKELEAFSKEELHEIVKDMLRKYLMESDVIESIFVDKNVDRYSSYTSKSPSRFLRDTVSNIDISSDLVDVKDAMIEDIKNNHRDILEDVLIKSIAKGFSDSWDKDSWFIRAYVDARNREANN